MNLQFLLDNLILFCMSIIVQENYKDISTDKCRWFLILKVFVIFRVSTESIIIMIWIRHGINSENLYSEWKRRELRFKSAIAVVTGRVTCPSCAWQFLLLGIRHWGWQKHWQTALLCCLQGLLPSNTSQVLTFLRVCCRTNRMEAGNFFKKKKQTQNFHLISSNTELTESPKAG